MFSPPISPKSFPITQIHSVDMSLPDQNVNGDTALHFAAARGEIEKVKQLLQQDIYKNNINIINNNGDTALHLAALRGFGSVAELLLKAGADKKIKNKAGLIPLDLAMNPGPSPFSTGSSLLKF